MSTGDVILKHLRVGRISAIYVFYLFIAYVIVTSLGFLSLKSPSDPIGDPYFTLMEILIIIIAPLMLIVMTAVNIYADDEVKIYSKIALILMIIMTTITSSVHFVVLTLSRLWIYMPGIGSSLFHSYLVQEFLEMGSLKKLLEF